MGKGKRAPVSDGCPGEAAGKAGEAVAIEHPFSSHKYVARYSKIDLTLPSMAWKFVLTFPKEADLLSPAYT